MSRRLIVAFTAVSEVFSRWIDAVCNLTASLLGQLASPRTVRLVEQSNNEFVLQANGEVSNINFNRIRISDGQIGRDTSALPPEALAGNHVELVLQPDQFLFRPLELPKRATEFMPGIVRSQIDRLTPWNAADTAFGWSKPVTVDAEKMVITIAATAFALIKPYVQAMTDIGVHSIAVFTVPPEPDADTSPIKVWEQKGQGAKDAGRLRQTLVTVLAIACITAAIAFGANVIVGTDPHRATRRARAPDFRGSLCSGDCTRFHDDSSARARAAQA